MNPKILKKTYFYSAKMAPKKVDNPLTFKGANLLTLWRPKRGQPSASPAYIYIYFILNKYIYITINQKPWDTSADWPGRQRYLLGLVGSYISSYLRGHADFDN